MASRIVSALLTALAVVPSMPAAARDCVWGAAGYRACVEDKIRRLKESEAQGRAATAPAAPVGRRAPSLPGPIAPVSPPAPPPVRELRVGPPPDAQFRIDADALRARIERPGPAAPDMGGIERELRLLSRERAADALDRNRRDFEIDQLRRRAAERRLFADPPGRDGTGLR